MRQILILNERDVLHPKAGGAEVNLFEVARRLVERGYRATLLCTAFAGARRSEILDGVEVRRLGALPAYYLRIPGEVRRLVGDDTVVIEHLCKLPFFAPLYARRPVVAVTHHLFGSTTLRQVSLPIATTVMMAELLIPHVYRHCEFIAVSPSTRDDLLRRGIDARRVRIIPNGVDCRHYEFRDSAGAPPALLAFGRVEPYKRLRLVVQAFERIRRAIPDARLTIIGGGTGLDALRQEIRRLKLEDVVTATGPVDEVRKLECIRKCHLVLNCSEKEGWGLTVLEAAACGRPTVASDVPGLRDSVLHERTGVLVPDGNVEAMASAAVALLRDTERRQLLGRAARNWAERFSWESVAEATARCIEESCGAAPVATTARWFSEAHEADGETVPLAPRGTVQ